MRISPKGLALIKEFEGLRTVAYLCPANVWTIGYGHTSAAGDPNVFPGMRITADQAEAILIRDLDQYEDAVLAAVKRPLTQGQFDACVSLCYNIGRRAFAGSTVVRRINAGRMQDVPAAFMMWTKAGGRDLPGLVRRRRAETALWRALPESHGTAGRADIAKVEEAPPDDIPASQSTPVLTAGGLAAAGTAIVPALTGVSNVWQAVSIGLVLIAAGIAAWLYLSGRITINRRPA